jgi:hypothetical protein
VSGQPAEIFDQALRQPDQRSCGATVLVVARMLLDDSYAEFIASGRHPRSGFALPGSVAARFRYEVLDMHRRVTGFVDVSGALQVPWPRAIGTPPWAVAHQLSGTGTEERPARHHSTHVVLDRGPAYDAVVAATADRRPVPVYVGSRGLPRHVVLAIGEVRGSLRFYDPASWLLSDVERGAFESAELGLSGWDRPWFVVLPDST